MNQNRRNLLALAASAAASPLLFAAEGGFPTKAIKIDSTPFSRPMPLIWHYTQLKTVSLRTRSA